MPSTVDIPLFLALLTAPGDTSWLEFRWHGINSDAGCRFLSPTAGAVVCLPALIAALGCAKTGRNGAVLWVSRNSDESAGSRFKQLITKMF
jgi:hypothetical protein